MQYDVTIIGGGIAGCSAAYELSKYQLSVLLLEKENDVSDSTTKANSGIVHAGYDPVPGTLMAKYNVEGNRMMRELAARLDVPYRQTGSLVLAFSEDEIETLRELLARGRQNGVPELSLLSGEEACRLEPQINPAVKGALYAKTAGVVSPWELALGLAEVAVRNGVELRRSCEVTAVQKEGGGFLLQTGQGEITSRFVVNAGGVYADRVQEMAGNKQFSIAPSRGEYYLLDKSQGNLVQTVLFQCPNKNGKGVLVAPTAHGNLIVGPNSAPCECDDTKTSPEGLASVREMSIKSVPSINFRENIRNFAGVRANSDHDDFIVGEDEKIKGFFNIAGIKSPGLTAAPAIAVDLVTMLGNSGLTLSPKPDFADGRKVVRFHTLIHEERQALIQKNPLYGRVICRCETITEGEIVDALHSPIPPVSIDGVKRRCGNGMGRCQGGFCSPRVHELIARELHIPLEAVLQDKAGSYLLTGKTKGVNTR